MVQDAEVVGSHKECMLV